MVQSERAFKLEPARKNCPPDSSAWKSHQSKCCTWNAVIQCRKCCTATAVRPWEGDRQISFSPSRTEKIQSKRRGETEEQNSNCRPHSVRPIASGSSTNLDQICVVRVTCFRTKGEQKTAAFPGQHRSGGKWNHEQCWRLNCEQTDEGFSGNSSAPQGSKVSKTTYWGVHTCPSQLFFAPLCLVCWSRTLQSRSRLLLLWRYCRMHRSWTFLLRDKESTWIWMNDICHGRM